jgi:hypothetical protein
MKNNTLSAQSKHIVVETKRENDGPNIVPMAEDPKIRIKWKKTDDNYCRTKERRNRRISKTNEMCSCLGI